MCARRQWNWRTINTLQSLNHVIMIKIKVPVLLLQVTVADFGYSVYAIWFFLLPKILKLFGFQIF